MSRYRERLWPTPWVFIVGLLIVPAIILVFAPINLTVGIILAIAVYLMYAAFFISSAMVIEVTEDQLRVGSARIPLVFAGESTPYETRDAARQAAGPGLDARAYLALRGWVDTSIRVDIDDENDPIPYWLFSTRHPSALRTAIAEAKANSRQ